MFYDFSISAFFPVSRSRKITHSKTFPFAQWHLVLINVRTPRVTRVSRRFSCGARRTRSGQPWPAVGVCRARRSHPRPIIILFSRQENTLYALVSRKQKRGFIVPGKDSNAVKTVFFYACFCLFYFFCFCISNDNVVFLPFLDVPSWRIAPSPSSAASLSRMKVRDVWRPRVPEVRVTSTALCSLTT